ncbi:ribonuclease P protein component [Candidatus Peribacteria bacterium]|nr:MAG: ribonuclease P protein component [Candidatus Peribacteria bacterium]
MKLLHIRSRKACDVIMRKGSVWKGKTMIVRWLPGAPKKEGPQPAGLYLGTYASAKLDKSAVKRNRMRRRCREAFRRLVKNQDDLVTAQLLVTPKIGTLVTPFEQIESDVRTFLSATNTWQNPKSVPPASSTSR